MKERKLQSYITSGKSVSVSLPPEKLVPFVQKIFAGLIAAGEPAPRIMHIQSPSLIEDLREVETAVTNHHGFPSEFKQNHPEFNIWLNPDEILETGLPRSFPRVGKYARNLLVFDHKYQFGQLPVELQMVLGGECNADFKFDE